jgi:tetratricopeptide (TPR) repeat protein
MDANPDFRFQTAADLQAAASQFIPEGFDGKAEVANLIYRNTSRLADGLYARLLEQGRPLLDDVPAPVEPEMVERRRAVDRDATEIIKPRDWRRILLFVLGGVVLGVAALVVVSRSGRNVEGPAVRPVAVPAPGPGPGSVPEPTPTPTPEPEPATGSRPPAPAPAPEPVRKTATPEPKIAPQPSTAKASADALLASAMESFEDSDIPKTLALAKLAAERGAGAPAYVLLGTCLYIKKDHPRAKDALEVALRLSPENVEAKRRLERIREIMPDHKP